jgi:hypothetical protein
MKSFLGFGLVILGVVSFFRYFSIYGVPDFFEFIGMLIGTCIFVIPGILLIKSDNKSKQ